MQVGKQLGELTVCDCTQEQQSESLAAVYVFNRAGLQGRLRQFHVAARRDVAAVNGAQTKASADRIMTAQAREPDTRKGSRALSVNAHKHHNRRQSASRVACVV